MEKKRERKVKRLERNRRSRGDPEPSSWTEQLMTVLERRETWGEREREREREKQCNANETMRHET